MQEKIALTKKKNTELVLRLKDLIDKMKTANMPSTLTVISRSVTNLINSELS